MADFDSFFLAEHDNMFPEIILEKARAYEISNSDILIYALFSKLSIPPMLLNYVKIPTNNKVLFDNFVNNKDLVNKKLAENFEVTLTNNKNISKKTKAKFTYDELNGIKNKHLMGVELLDVYTNNSFENLFEKVMEAIDSDRVGVVALSYLLGYLCFNESEQKQIMEALKSKSEFFMEKVRFKIEEYFDFSVGVLRLANKGRYDLFVDQELVKMSEYMRKEKDSIMVAFSSDEKKYLDMIESLTFKLNQLEKENIELKTNNTQKQSKLKGKKVLVIGDTSRRDSYREIVENQGGYFDFMDGIFEPEKISFMSEKADIAILVIPRIKHSVSCVLKNKKIQTIFVNNAGVSSFEEVINDYCFGEQQKNVLAKKG
jgi:hypothetical protein